jgi:hypothetical protein
MEEIMDSKSLIKLAMDTLSRMNGDRRVVLYLDASMIHAKMDGYQRYLPVMNLEGDDGYYRFPEGIRDQVSDHFGALIEPARAQVAEMNRANGFTEREVLEIVTSTMARSQRQ